MGKKNKKKNKQDSVADNLLDLSAVSIKKYRKVTNELAKLGPGQKLVGGLLLAAAGYFYYKNLQNEDWQDSPVAALLPLPWLPAARGAHHPAPGQDEDEPAEDAVVLPASSKKHKAPKAAKPARHAGAFGKKAAASPEE